MSETGATGAVAPGQSSPDSHRLSIDIDVDVCVIGAGLAGLTVALEAARQGARVVVLEGRHVGWGASGHQLGAVIPSYDMPLDALISRAGIDAACEMWQLAAAGSLYIKEVASTIAGSAIQSGALEVSAVDTGDALVDRLTILGGQFGIAVEGWQRERVRATLNTERYFHAIHYSDAFQVNAAVYLRGLADLVRAAGAEIYERTPAVEIDPVGVRKRVVTPDARVRASHVVLAGSIHLGDLDRRLAETLVPTWRYAGITEPLGDRLAETVGFAGSVFDADRIDHFRIVDGDRLMWSYPTTTWRDQPERYRRRIVRRIHAVFPALGPVEVSETFSGGTGCSVQGMPQIGQVHPGVWVASGFGQFGMATSAMAAQLIAQGMFARDDRWRLFAGFDLVWAGGVAGRVAVQAANIWTGQGAALAGALARQRDRRRRREELRVSSDADTGSGDADPHHDV